MATIPPRSSDEPAPRNGDTAAGPSDEGAAAAEGPQMTPDVCQAFILLMTCIKSLRLWNELLEARLEALEEPGHGLQ